MAKAPSAEIGSRLEKYIARTDTCWLWTGYIAPTGYGVLNIGGRPVGGHHIAYEVYRGPIPAGLQIDHLCRNRACVNPDHLELVTSAENTRRGRDARLGGKCGRGHVLRVPGALCLECKREWYRRAGRPTRIRTCPEHGEWTGYHCQPCHREYLRDWRASRREVAA